MKRKALFVGICDYSDSGIPSLPWTANDARVLSFFFRSKLGYETQTLIDATATKLKQSLEEITQELTKGDLFLFYFAGHGNSTNLACYHGERFPLVDVKKLIDRDFDTIVISDSCRTNEDSEKSHNSQNRDLTFISNSTNPTWLNSVFSANGNGARAIIYACEEGCPASDDPEHGHGLFTQAFLTELRSLRWGGRKVCVDGHLGDSIGTRMEKLLNFRQRPHVENVGRVPVLMEGKGLFLKSVVSCVACAVISVAVWVGSDYPDGGAPSSYQPQERYERGESFLDRVFFKEQNRKNALIWIEDAAKNDCADAQYAMGEILEYGELDQHKNEIEALVWYKRAAEKNHVMALCKICSFFVEGKGGVDIDYKVAFKYAYSAATNGFPQAQKAVGDCYLMGVGDLSGETNLTEAIRFYNLAAAQGETDALLALYRLYRYGAGNMASNTQAAVSYLLRAVDAGSPLAQADLGGLYMTGKLGFRRDSNAAFEMFLKAANQGCDYGQYNVAECYAYGNGVDKNSKASVGWYRKAAEQDFTLAQLRLGDCYCLGEGVSRDDVEGVKWYRRAAEKGDVRAQFSLGGHYSTGEGVAQNDEEAVKWFRKAAEKDHACAQDQLGMHYDNGIGIERNEEEAIKWYRKAAEQNLASAQCHLGTCYYLGEGVEKNFVEAVKWYRKSADNGYASAQFNLGVCYDKGEGVAQDEKEAIEWYRKAANQGYEKAKKVLGRGK